MKDFLIVDDYPQDALYERRTVHGSDFKYYARVAIAAFLVGAIALGGGAVIIRTDMIQDQLEHSR